VTRRDPIEHGYLIGQPVAQAKSLCRVHRSADRRPEAAMIAARRLPTEPGDVSDATIKNHAAFIWSVADLLRGDYKQSEYGKVILPLTVLRRLDCVLEPTKGAVLERAKKLKGKVDNVGPVLRSESGEQFFNTSPLDFR